MPSDPGESRWTIPFASALGFGGVVVVTALLTQVVRNKVLAVLIGPEGMGLWGLVQSVGSTLSAVTFLGVGGGVSILISQDWSAGRHGQAWRLLASSLIFTLAAGILALGVLLPFSSRLAEAWLGSPSYGWLVVAIIVVNPMANAGLALAAAMQGLYFVRSQVILGISTYAVVTVLCVVGAVAAGAEGAAFGWVISGLWGPVVAFLLLNRDIAAEVGRLFKAASARLTPRALAIDAKRLAPYSVSTLLGSAGAAGASFVVRLIVLKALNVEGVGLYATVAGISGTGIIMLQNLVSMYAVPQTARAADSDQGPWPIVHKVGRVLALASLPLFLIELQFPERILATLFSPEFASAAYLLRLFVVGDFLQLLAWLFVLSLNSQRLPSRVLVARAFEAAAAVVCTAILVPAEGLTGAGYAYILQSALLLLVLVLVDQRERRRAPGWVRSVAAWSSSLITILAALYLGTRYPFVPWMIALPAALLAVSRAERRRIREVIREYLGR